MLSNPAVTRRLLKEISKLTSEPPEGIRISTNDEDMLDVTGIIAGPAGTPYEGGYFRVKFVFTEEFPSAPPKCRMMTKIFHPNVSSSGEICVNTLKKDWKSTYGIEHILVTVKCLLIYPNAESALDEDAGRELLENYEGYSSRARLITSVHATPKSPPPEFDTPSKIPDSPEVASTSTDEPTTAPAITIQAPPAIVNTPSGSENNPGPNAAAVVNVSMAKPRSKSSTSNPLVSVIPPLQPATTNTQLPGKEPIINGSNGAMKLDTKEGGVVSGGARSRAVKRTATSAAVGADKRKKALKRL